MFGILINKVIKDIFFDGLLHIQIYIFFRNELPILLEEINLFIRII